MKRCCTDSVYDKPSSNKRFVNAVLVQFVNVNVTVSALNTNLSGLRVIPFRPQVSSHWTAWKRLSAQGGTHIGKGYGDVPWS